VPIAWVEYTPEALGFRAVDFNTASRNGEPFALLIEQRMKGEGGLPNRVARYCSSELKTRAMHKYIRSLGVLEWDTFIGIRADEPSRVARIRGNPSPETKDETVRVPLADAGVGAHHVGAFWAGNGFDLELPNVQGKTMHGNCDLCFLKPSAQVVSLISEKPGRAIWWAAQEAKAAAAGKGASSAFRNDRPSCAQMLAFTREQVDAFGHAAAQANDGIECVGCTD
jgi:3'-phosphoadenosine 5'-phosphosulfate sulfotransferase (PAPS reductase)/FAD synthetase